MSSGEYVGILAGMKDYTYLTIKLDVPDCVAWRDFRLLLFLFSELSATLKVCLSKVESLLKKKKLYVSFAITQVVLYYFRKKGFVCLIHKRVEYVWKISQALVWINGCLFRAHSYNFLRIYKPIIELLFNNNYAWMRACMLSNFKLFRFFKVRNFSPLPFFFLYRQTHIGICLSIYPIPSLPQLQYVIRVSSYKAYMYIHTRTLAEFLFRQLQKLESTHS